MLLTLLRARSFLKDLSEVLKKRRIIAIYLWNFNEIDELSEAGFKMPIFYNWFEALQNGNLDHRGWIFEERTLKEIAAAYRAVRRGREPNPGVIDIEPWTIQDLYRYHPRGNEADFWREIIVAIRERKAIIEHINKP